MTQSRRDFLGSVACAFAAAGVACKVPGWATVAEDMPALLPLTGGGTGATPVGSLRWLSKHGIYSWNGYMWLLASNQYNDVKWSYPEDPTTWTVPA